MTDPERPQVTPEGHTPEEPAPSELGKVGTPGAGMTPATPHAADAHDVDKHVDAHADSGDAHGEPRLGPVDWPAWGYAVVGAVIGLLIAGMFYVATV